jgi:outer membrane biosynthesis protein TonB
MIDHPAVYVLLALLAAGCGPKTDVPAQEPEPPTPEPGETESSPAEEAAPPAEPPEPGPEPGPEPAPEPDEAAPESASKKEVKPIMVKNFDVQTNVVFTPSLDAAKKEKAVEKIGIATGGITTCYTKLLEDDDALEGEIEVAFQITPAGVPKAFKTTKNTTGSTGLEKCMVKNLKKQKFPKKLGKKAVKATVPITFLPYKDE